MILAELLLPQLHLRTCGVDQVLGFDSFQHLQLSQPLFVGLYFFLEFDLGRLGCWEDYRGSGLGILSGLLVCFVYQLEEENEGDQQNCSDQHEDQFNQLSSFSFFFLIFGVLALERFFLRFALIGNSSIFISPCLFFCLLLITNILRLSRTSSRRQRPFKASSFSIPSSSFARSFSLPFLCLREANQKGNNQDHYCDFPHARK